MYHSSGIYSTAYQFLYIFLPNKLGYSGLGYRTNHAAVVKFTMKHVCKHNFNNNSTKLTLARVQASWDL